VGEGDSACSGEAAYKFDENILPSRPGASSTLQATFHLAYDDLFWQDPSNHVL